MSVENRHIGGDASVGRNATMGGNARVQGSVRIGHNLRVDGRIECNNIKAANKGLFLDESQLNKAYPNPQDGWFAGVGSNSPFVVYIARDGEWVRTTGTFSVEVDMDSYNQRIDGLESQLESNNQLIAELIEIIQSGGGSADLVMITIENYNPTWGSVSGGGLKRKGSVTVTATAENGYHFVEWQDAEGNTIAGAGAEYTFDATESVTLKAVFAVSYFTVTVGTDQGNLGEVGKTDPQDTANGYVFDEEVTVTAVPKQAVATAYFVHWEDSQGVVKSTSASYTFNVTENVTLKAVFAEVAVIDRGIDDQHSTGTGTITATVTRGGVDVEETDVRIGDHILITLTGTSNKPNSLTVGGVEVQCTPSPDGKVWTYDFDYTGSESLTFRATFSIVSRTVSVNVKNGQSSWGSAEVVFDGESKSSVTVAENTDVLLRATANNGYAFAHWKKGVETLGWTAEKTLGVTESTAGTYTAEFEHNTAPDFYFGAVNTPSGNDHAADYSDLIGQLTGGYLADNNKATFNLPPQKTYIILYDATKVVPSGYKVTTPGFAPSQGTDFDDEDKFYLSTKENGNVTYNTIELRNGNRSDSITQSVEITFAANSNSQE